MEFNRLNMPVSEMTANVKRTIAKLCQGYASLFGHPPASNDIAFACKSDECGWWTDRVNNILAREIEVPKKFPNGDIDPSGRSTAVALCCPECGFRLKAVAMHIWLKKCGSRRLARKYEGKRIIVPGGLPN